MFCCCTADDEASLPEGILPPSESERGDEKPKSESAPIQKLEESRQQTAAEDFSDSRQPAPPEVVADIQGDEQESRESSVTNIFEIVVSRSGPNKGLGLDTTVQRHPVQLLVSAVRPGVIEEWNAANPTKVVLPGDAIKAVNGESSDIDRMYHEMGRARVLRIQLRRL